MFVSTALQTHLGNLTGAQRHLLIFIWCH